MDDTKVRPVGTETRKKRVIKVDVCLTDDECIHELDQGDVLTIEGMAVSIVLERSASGEPVGRRVLPWTRIHEIKYYKATNE